MPAIHIWYYQLKIKQQEKQKAKNPIIKKHTSLLISVKELRLLREELVDLLPFQLSAEAITLEV